MTLVQSLLAAQLAPSRADLNAAVRNSDSRLYQDTTQRRAMRALLDGAALAGAQVKLAFYKADWSLRYMLCLPCVDTDPTCRYMTVVDVEASAKGERAVHRRVCLDTIASVAIEFKAGALTATAAV